MKKHIITLLLSTILCFTALTIFAQTEKKPELLTKETFKQKVWDYEKSREFIYLGDKPCIIDFDASWCGWCKKIAPFFVEFCSAYEGQIYVYKINTDQQKELQALFQATSLPTVVFIPMTGKPTSTRGALSKEKYINLIETLLLPPPPQTLEPAKQGKTKTKK